MLVLTRTVGNGSIVIGDDIVVSVLKVSGGGQVRIGIEAPDNVPIHRMEIYNKIRREKAAQDEQ